MWWLASHLAVFLGGGGGLVDIGSKYDPRPALALEAGAGYRVGDFAFGVHTRFSSVHDSDADNTIPYVTEWDYAIHTYDLGAAVRYAHGRFGVQPWLGVHFTTGTLTTTYNLGPYPPGPLPPDAVKDLDFPTLFAYGVLGTVDVDTSDPNRVSIFIDLQSSSERDRGIGSRYGAITLGFAYRR